MWHTFKEERGFSLMELLVTIAIVGLMLTVVVSGRSTSTEGANMRSAVNKLESYLRQAQVYGVGVREFTPGSADFSASYGVSINIDSDGGNNAYIYFADRGAKNNKYDSGWSCPSDAVSECLEKVTLPQGYYISSVCIQRTSGTDLCNVGRVDLVFVRPSPGAVLSFFNNGGSPYNPGNIKGAEVTLASPKGLTKKLVVYPTGQISIQ